MRKIISIIAVTAFLTTAFTGCDDIDNSVISNSINDTSSVDTLDTTVTSETIETTQETLQTTAEITMDTESSNSQTSSQETSPKPTIPVPTISMAIDETVAENNAIIKIPTFNANSNSGADALNARIKSELKAAYDSYKADVAQNGQDAGWIDVNTYTFNSDKYIQAISLLGEFPSYGTDGKIYSYNYDVMSGKALDLAGVMEQFGVTQSAIENAMATAFKPESETRKIVSVEPTAFRIGEDDTADIYLYVYSDDPNSTPDTRIWIYNSQSKVCFQYDKNTTFQ